MEKSKIKIGNDEMTIHMARPKTSGKAPALFVIQEAFGVNQHISDVTNKLSEQGYLAVAPELFYRTAPPGWEGSYGDISSCMPHIQALTPENLRTDFKALTEWVGQDKQFNGKLGCIGFCMGGRVSFFANGHLPLTCAVSYYGGRIVPDLLPLAAKQNGPLLLIWGGKDKHIGPDQRRMINDALTAAHKNFIDVEFSDADHGFFCDYRASYNKNAAAQAWPLTLSFLKTYLLN